MTNAELAEAIRQRLQDRMGYTQPNVGDVVVELLREIGFIK